MQPDYDILIAGAGPAGCAAAYDLARAGFRVLMLDKRSFPRHKACACGLTRKTLAALRYSVDPVTERVCHEIVLQPASTTNLGGPFIMTASSSSWVGSASAPSVTASSSSRVGSHHDRSPDVRVRTKTPICAMAVRSRFDAFCLDQTLAAGRNGGTVTLRKIDTIIALRQTDTHIELDIAFRSPDGADRTETLRAPVLIGADGSNGQTRRLANALPTCNLSSRITSSLSSRITSSLSSRITSNLSSRPERSEAERPVVEAATTVDPAWYQKGFALEATVPFSILHKKRSPSAQDHDLIFDFAPLPGGYGWLFPKGDHINIGVGAFAPSTDPGTPPLSAAERVDSETWVPADLKSVTRQLLLDYTHQKLGLTPPDLDNLHVTGQYLGMGGHAYLPAGRVLLVGDAAGLVDPLTGEGIHSAIVSGQAAAAAILQALPRPTNPALKGTGLSPSVSSHREKGALAPEGVAAAYARHLAPLQQTLAFSHRAAQAFYRQPERGFKAMRIPILRGLILKTYADGLPHTRLLTALARLV